VKRRTEPTPVASVIPRVLDELGFQAGPAMRLHAAWDDAVGAEVAAHAQPDVLRGSTLDVVVDTSVWCQQLQLRRMELLARLREVLGEEAPSELRLRVGSR